MTTSQTMPADAARPPAGKGDALRRRWVPLLLIFAAAAVMPFIGNDYWVLIASRAAIYWVLVSGLNLIVGYAGQLAIGWVALLTLGAYSASVLTAGNVSEPWSPYLAMGAAALLGALAGVIVGLPALRLRTFYFAITTLGFSTIVTQIALAWQDVTGGGIGVSGPMMPPPFDTAHGFYGFCLAIAAVCTWMTVNVAQGRFGRALVAVRDAEVAAEASGIGKSRLLMTVFLFSGALAGVAGALFASLQTYITPEAFTFELSVLFFICVLIGGRGSIVGPLLATILLTLLPEVAAPLARWSTFLYAVLLLAIVLLAPGGIAALLDFRSRRPIEAGRVIRPRPSLLEGLQDGRRGGMTLSLSAVELAFGAVRAVDGVDLRVGPGQVHGLIGPNGSGKTTILNLISGYYAPTRGTLGIGERALAGGEPQSRAGLGVARTFQTPRIIGEASVLQNVQIGGWTRGQASFAESVLSLPRHRRDERRLAADAMQALRIVGLEGLADVRADRLQHSELRFLEIARALVLRPDFLLLDEPAAGLAVDEIERLGELVSAISRQGTGVLLVEHHADLIFAICDHVTVLNLGKVLAQGTPAEIRVHKEVVSAYLGS